MRWLQAPGLTCLEEEGSSFHFLDLAILKLPTAVLSLSSPETLTHSAFLFFFRQIRRAGPYDEAVEVEPDPWWRSAFLLCQLRMPCFGTCWDSTPHLAEY